MALMGSRTPVAVIVCVAVLLVVAGPARADAKPEPVISGIPQVAEMLIADLNPRDDPLVVVDWQWLRCPPLESDSCQEIAGAMAAGYLVEAADLGFRLRVRVTFIEVDGGALGTQRSQPTDVVVGAAPMREPTMTLSPPPQSVSAPASGPSRRARPKLLDPFPIIRIRGRLTETGARVTLLTVRAARGVRITVRCYGPSCPTRRVAIIAAVARLHQFERELQAGTRLEIKVTKPNYIGKWSVITIRRGRPPSRLDRCVYPGGRRPVRCPH